MGIHNHSNYVQRMPTIDGLEDLVCCTLLLTVGYIEVTDERNDNHFVVRFSPDFWDNRNHVSPPPKFTMECTMKCTMARCIGLQRQANHGLVPTPPPQNGICQGHDSHFRRGGGSDKGGHDSSFRMGWGWGPGGGNDMGVGQQFHVSSRFYRNDCVGTF